MGYLLLLLLFLELWLFYYFNGRNVVTPSFLGCAVFIFSTVIYLVSGDYYQYELHGKTVAVILFLLMCVFVGEVFAEHLKMKRGEQIVAKPPETPTWCCLTLAVVVLGLSLLRFYEIYQFSLEVGNEPGNIWTMAKYVREARLSGNRIYDLSIFASQGTVISSCLLYFSVYSLCANYNQSEKIYGRYFLPIIGYLPQIMASDDRTGFLRSLTVCTIIIFVFVKQKNNWTKRGNAQIIFWGVLIICAFLVCFRWLGYRTEASLRAEAWDNITEYTSAGLVGLDKYLQSEEPPNTLFAQGTFSSIYAILRQWGAHIPEVAPFESFFTYARGEANIYTGFKAYIKDFTLLGAAAVMFLWGVVINCCMKRIRLRGTGFVRLCVTGMLFYPVVMLSIADVSSTVLTISMVYTWVYLTLIDLFLVRGKIQIRFGTEKVL